MGTELCSNPCKRPENSGKASCRKYALLLLHRPAETRCSHFLSVTNGVCREDRTARCGKAHCDDVQQTNSITDTFSPAWQLETGWEP